MKNKNITRKITQGMYVLTTNEGGCIVDAVSQISSGDSPLIAVSVMKSNNTNVLLKNNDKFALSILSKDVNPSIITTFGFASSKDINKFENITYFEEEGIKIIKDAVGYMLLERVDMIDNETHTLFIGRLIEGDILQDKEAMSYGYYQEHKGDYVKIKTNNGDVAWVCTVCGYVYYGEMIEDDFKCPICGVGKALFKKKN